MKKTLFCVLCLCMAVPAAFAGGGDEAGSESASDWPFANTPNAELEGSIDVWHWHSTMEVTYPACLEAAGFYKDYPGIEVNLIKTGEGHDQFLVALAANTGLPDVVYIDSAQYGALVQKKAAQDLTERMLPHKDDFFPVAWNILDVEGKIYGMPDVFGSMTLIYRTDIFEAAGLPTDPEEVSELLSTFDKYIEVGKTIKEKTGALLVCMGPTVSWNFQGIQNQVVSGLIDREGNVLIDSPEMIKVTEILGEIWDLGLSKEYPPFTAQWFQDHKDGVFATRFNHPWMTEFLTRNIPETNGLWKLIPLPAFYEGAERGSVRSVSVALIPDGIEDKQKEMAWRFLESIYTSVEGNLPFMVGDTGWPGNFYSYMPAIETLRDTEFPLLGGQTQYEIYYNIMTSKDIIAPYQPAGSAKANELWFEAIFKVMEEDADVETVLKAAADQMRRELKE